jgi:hypothetical protein
MSSREAEQQRRQQEAEHQRDQALDDQRVLTFREWCQFNRFSVSTGRRLIRAGQGPIITRISDRKLGVTVANNRRWQQSRERA